MENPPPNDLNANLPEDEPVQPEHAPAMLGFTPVMLNIPNNNGWIEWDVPQRGEMDEPMVDPGFNEEEMDDDDDVWDEDDEWRMDLVTPPRATVTVLSTYEMDNLEYRHGVLTRKMEAMSNAKVADSIAIGEIFPRVATIEGQVQEMASQAVQLVSKLEEMETRVHQDTKKPDTDIEKDFLKVRRLPKWMKVSPWKGVIRFGKHVKLSPWYVRLFKIIDRIGLVAYKLELPDELHGIQNTFHVSNLKKCLTDGDYAYACLDGSMA
uniref:Tf2-1-like SH3-like domain-containing protein n=1 Tax=Tanacetum cinerariifolium TaxID=118510 RepID=A0A6L2MAX3_TANCI|nr:hypothetical protein [Tanacetum cinerariifolium]